MRALQLPLRRQRGPGEGGADFPTRFHDACAAGHWAHPHMYSGDMSFVGSRHTTASPRRSCHLHHLVTRGAQLQRGGVTGEGISHAEEREVRLSIPATLAAWPGWECMRELRSRRGRRERGTGVAAAGAGVGLAEIAVAGRRRPATAAPRSGLRIMSSRRRLWRRQLVWLFLDARSKRMGHVAR